MNVKRLCCVAMLCTVLGVFSGATAWAGAFDAPETSSPQKVVDGMANKAARGLANLTTGWIEFPKQIYQTYNQQGGTKGALVGPIKGIGMALVRTAAGLGELVTFFVAYPGFYEPYFEPEFVWEKE